MLNIGHQPRRRVVVAVGLLGLATIAAACGDDDNSAGGGGRTEVAESADTDADPGTDTESDTDGAATGECREIDHEAGTACVPAEPQRIVALDTLTVLPTLLELDAPVVGAASVYATGQLFPGYLDPDEVEGIEVVGDMQAPNIEAIAATRPDLIIGSQLVVEPILDQLEAIAPTVVTRYTFYESGWRDDVRLVAEAVDATAAIDEALGELDERIAEVRAGLDEQGGSHTLTRIDVFQGSPVYYRFGCTWFGEVLTAAGVSQPEAQGPDECSDGDYESVLVYPSLERLDVLDADAIVAYQQQTGEDEVGADPLAKLATSPLWNQLSAVQDDRVHVLGDAWGLGGSITSALLVLDDVEQVVFPAGQGGQDDG